MADLVMRDAAQLGPFAERADRWLTTRRKEAAGAEAGGVGERIRNRTAANGVSMPFA
jgi:hypothetical protein